MDIDRHLANRASKANADESPTTGKAVAGGLPAQLSNPRRGLCLSFNAQIVAT